MDKITTTDPTATDTSASHFWKWVAKGVLWLLSVVIAAVVAGWLQSYFAYRYDKALQDRQERIAAIEQFKGSAKELDGDWQAFNDALVDNREIEDSRRDLRASLSKHSADTNLIRTIVDKDLVSKYMADLAVWRKELDAVKDPTNAMQMTQTALDILSEREKLLKAAQR